MKRSAFFYLLHAHLVPAMVLLLCGANMTQAAGPEITKEKFPDYNPAHTVIKCPYIPAGMVEIPKCGGLEATCVGTAGRDLILGTDKNDVIVALEGDDVVHGDAADDVICGGPGADSLMGARGADRIYGGPGNDWLFGAPEADELYGEEGDDVLWGGPGVDYLDGGPGEFDVCLLQRELANFNRDTCNTVYPPPGYEHEDEPDPGVLRQLEPLKLK